MQRGAGPWLAFSHCNKGEKCFSTFGSFICYPARAWLSVNTTDLEIQSDLRAVDCILMDYSRHIFINTRLQTEDVKLLFWELVNDH